MRSLMPKQSEGNKHTSKINVFPVSHWIFFLLGGKKWILPVAVYKVHFITPYETNKYIFLSGYQKLYFPINGL